jgi:hypothetical protein
LVIAQTTFNSSQSDGNFTISVLKKSENGTETLYGPGSELALYKDDSIDPIGIVGGEGANKNNWVTQSYSQYASTPITYTLKSADGAIIWDKEVIEFTRDGAGIKKIDTYVRDFPYSIPDENGYAWTTPKTGSSTAFADIGHSEMWTTGTDYNNSHILVGDTAYLVGTVSDRYYDSGVK